MRIPDNRPVMKYFDPDKSIGFLLYEVSRLMRRDFDERAKKLGLTQVQWRAIVHIAKQEGCNQAVLADQLEVKPITLTRLIDRLAEAGWVVRLPDQKDRRAVQLHLTEKARPLFKTMREEFKLIRAKALQGISEEQLDVLLETLVKMKANFNK